MKSRFGTALWGLAVCVLGTSVLKAEDPGVAFAFKLRAQIAHPGKEDGMTNGVFGRGLELGPAFGLEGSYPLGSGRISAELGYSVMTGDESLADLSGMEKSGAGVTINAGTSVESRKNKMDGMMLRLGYEAPLSGKLAWRAGLQFGGNKFTHQILGNINGTDAGGAFHDNYYRVATKSSMVPSPYGGLTYSFNESSALEFGVLLLNYSALSYHHVADTNNSADTMPSKSKLLPAFEAAYVFRF
jgi:hypothetical protein